MMELVETAQKSRATIHGRIGGFPCGNTASAGAGGRFRALIHHENATFSVTFARR